MQRFAYTLAALVVFSGAACHRQFSLTESKLVGDWSIPRGANPTEDGFTEPNRGFDVTTLGADHTFSQTTHPSDAPPAKMLSGTWHIDGNSSS